TAALDVGGHRVVLKLIAQKPPITAGPRLAHRVDGKAAGAIEIHGPGAALGGRDLRDVVRGRLGRQRPEQWQRHVDAIEVIDVLLSAGARARSPNGVLRVLHAGNELQEVAILLAKRESLDLV